MSANHKIDLNQATTPTRDLNRKTSIDQSSRIQARTADYSDLSKLNKICIPRAFNLSQIEGWETKPSEDGTKISLQLNINFNLKAILVARAPE